MTRGTSRLLSYATTYAANEHGQMCLCPREATPTASLSRELSQFDREERHAGPGGNIAPMVQVLQGRRSRVNFSGSSKEFVVELRVEEERRAQKRVEFWANRLEQARAGATKTLVAAPAPVFAARLEEPGSRVRSHEPQPEESGPIRKWWAEDRVVEP